MKETGKSKIRQAAIEKIETESATIYRQTDPLTGITIYARRPLNEFDLHARGDEIMGALEFAEANPAILNGRTLTRYLAIQSKTFMKGLKHPEFSPSRLREPLYSLVRQVGLRRVFKKAKLKPQNSQDGK